MVSKWPAAEIARAFKEGQGLLLEEAYLDQGIRQRARFAKQRKY